MNEKLRLLKKLSISDFLHLFIYSLKKIIKPKSILIDLSLIPILRNEKRHLLLDEVFLEKKLLPNLGFNNELLHEFPQELYRYCGKGLYCWQYPNQFSKYLVSISKLGITSYLEIGVHKGGTFVITVEYLRRFNTISKAVGIDIVDCPSLFEYKKLNPVAEFLNVSSKSKEFANYIKSKGPFDLVLIDGDHSEDACYQDFRTIKDNAKVIVFHDIVSDLCPGVQKVWKSIKDEYKETYDFFEFIEQYPDVQKRLNMNVLGLGLAIKKKK